MDKKTKEALEGSIEKWKNIVYYGGEDRGVENCPLCELFTEEYIICNECPVGESTGHHLCGNTPYKEWIIHHEGCHNSMHPHIVQCSTCWVIAEREFYFLCSLRPLKSNLRAQRRNKMKSWPPNLKRRRKNEL